jgi:hypothetical protein
MAVDPETGIWTPDVTRQPFGAMSAVMALSNSQKANSIADQLMQGRQQALEAQQFKTQHEQQQADWEAQAHEAMQSLPEDATDQQMINTYVRSGGDLARALPWMRANTAATTKLDLEDMKYAHAALQQAKLKGATPDQLESIVRSTPLPSGHQMTDEGIAQLRAFGVLPQVGADIAKTQAQTAEAEQRTMTNAQLPQHWAEMERLRGQAIEILKGGGVLKPREEAAIRQNITANEARIAAISKQTTERDPLTFKFKVLTADEQDAIKQMKDQNESLQGILDANEKKRAGAASTAGAAAPALAGEDETDPFGAEKRGLIGPASR